MKTAISCKYMYKFIGILIALYSTMPLMIQFFNMAKPWIPSIYRSYTDNEVIPTRSPAYLAIMILVIIYILLDLSINTLLLCLYVKALHIYSKVFARDNSNHKGRLLDDRQHELMLEAARYTVLFGTLLLFNVCGIVGIGIYLYYLTRKNSTNYADATELISQCIGLCVLVVKEVLLLMATKLSFIFSHSDYEKLCKKCDEFVKERCQDLVRKRNGYYGNKTVREIVVNSNTSNNQINQPLLGDCSSEVEMDKFD